VGLSLVFHCIGASAIIFDTNFFCVCVCEYTLCDISLPLLSGSRIARARPSAARQLYEALTTQCELIAEAAKSMPAFDLLSKERVRSRRILVDQPAAAGGSRAAPEGHERGLEPGTSDPQRRLEGDQGRYAGCVRRA